MIKHHPTTALLKTYIAGELPTSLSIVIAAHAELCPCCQEQLELLQVEAANKTFSSIEFDNFDDVDLTLDFEDMISAITTQESQDSVTFTPAKKVTVKGQDFQLPHVLNNVTQRKWTQLGKLSRTRLDLSDGDLHCNLLHIDKQGEVPPHTHSGFELTLILSGSFHDEMGSYQAGDFIWLDGQHTHNPTTDEGCLCLTVANSGPQFTKGLSKLFNPLTNYFY